MGVRENYRHRTNSQSLEGPKMCEERRRPYDLSYTWNVKTKTRPQGHRHREQMGGLGFGGEGEKLLKRVKG